MRPDALPYIDMLQPYQPGTPIEVVARRHSIDPARIIKLASNENPAGMSPKAAEAIRLSLPEAHRYPDTHQLLRTLAHRHDVSTEQIILGNGSVDILNMIAMTYLDESSSAVSSEYAFAIYRLVTLAVGAENIIVPAVHHGHDLTTMVRAIREDTKVVWIANPNNPTGTFVPYAKVRIMLESVRKDILVVLDEAYYDYLPEEQKTDSASWLTDFPNLLLLRTFSKIFGMAGMRLGYALASADIIDKLNRARMPFNASVPALHGAMAALQDEEFVRTSVLTNEEGRTYLERELRNLGLEILPSAGNFITANVGDAVKIYEALERKGVIVRPLNGYGMPEWIRITVGLPPENDAFIRAIKSLVSSGD